MHITLPQEFEKKLTFLRWKLLPRTLFFRTMLLIFVPLIVVQIVSVVVFFDGSWSRMGRKMSENLVDDMEMLISLHEEGMPLSHLQSLAGKNLQISFDFSQGEQKNLSKTKLKANPIVVAYLREALNLAFAKEKWKILLNKERQENGDLIVTVEKNGGVYRFVCSKKKIFSSSVFMFVVWMVATSVLLFLVSVLFLRIQVRSIADLAQTAENFGKGIYDDGFKPYGSSEVRKAGYAFLTMRERIVKQIVERTQMLAGISHDLRTPLTRMKLMLAMTKDTEDKKDILADVDEMEKMLNGYLSFVRGEGDEPVERVDLTALVKDICDKFVLKKTKIICNLPQESVEIVVKNQALRRAITNIVANADRYAKKIEVTLKASEKFVNIIVDDNGPGIPSDKREEVFRAFYRLEKSRNKETGGIGLGLAITKDIVTAHGGKISLEESPLGGLRVVIELPR